MLLGVNKFQQSVVLSVLYSDYFQLMATKVLSSVLNCTVIQQNKTPTQTTNLLKRGLISVPCYFQQTLAGHRDTSFLNLFHLTSPKRSLKERTTKSEKNSVFALEKGYFDVR